MPSSREAADAASRPPHDLTVAVLPPIIERGLPSMSRFAGELITQLGERPGVSVVVPADTARGSAPRRSLGHLTRAATRFVWYPYAVRRIRGDVFHVLDQGYAHLIGVLPPGRAIATCHDLIPLRAMQTESAFKVPQKTRAWYPRAVSFLRRAAHVACVSEATRRDVINLLDVAPARTSVVRLGISELFRPLPVSERSRIRARFPADAHLLLHVSSGAAYKNVEGTISVVASLRARGIDTSLLRVGPPLTDRQRAFAASRGVSSYLRELGTVDDGRLVELYNAADAVIMPSHWEGFGWPAAEALKCGAPTVVADCAPLQETAGDAALAAPADDAEALAAAVMRLRSSPDLRAKLRERGLRRTRELTWRTTADGYAELYGAIARRSPR